MATSNLALTVSRALLGALIGCIALWGCTTTVHDLVIAGVSVTNSDEWFPKSTRRSLLRVDLTTQVDLSKALLRWEMLIHADVVFCSHPNDVALLGYSLYTTTPQAGKFPRDLNSLNPVEYSGAAEKWTYYLPLDIALPASPSSRPPKIGFDLLNNPEDICISLRGASMPWTMKWRYVRSNTVRLSSTAIREALRSGQMTERPSLDGGLCDHQKEHHQDTDECRPTQREPPPIPAEVRGRQASAVISRAHGEIAHPNLQSDNR